MQVTKFAIPEIIFGNGSIKFLASCARRLGAKRVLLVSDKGIEKAGWVQLVLNILESENLDCAYFDELTANPRDCQIQQGAKIYREHKADVIIGLGGGSPIDASKGIAIIVSNGGKIHDYEGANRIRHPLPPMIFIPTTAGSGSDVSQYAIITDKVRQVKMAIISRSLVPNISIIDPDLLITKSRQLILASAVDALAHAIESYVSQLASPFTETQALTAIKLIAGNIKKAADHKDPEALKNLSIASTAAGMSFSNAGLGVGHALAHSLGGRYDVTHGMTLPILLPSVMRFNLPSCEEKMATIARTINENSPTPNNAPKEHISDTLQHMFESMEIPMQLRKIVPDNTKLEEICRLAVQDACAVTNPREATWQDLYKICKEAW
ncbi:iron-containing alcohol dehydrogenase [Maridesulfovibrio hydrothermalis]|uniref:Iron-containing alcohol dehydrogenase n=1 Tax=Maridesulfovibrio hydrothermalis AM13 = DSM 14728 TaxID=1121451 RepID=L0RAX3_9BACT|nr:iron-containing alcohol dehydrogenase [Maridesulfovibrio hydrothermalis]CCO22731.1 Iron-containing alcohol dehydrogenase [Maridesulfovibrio hydrothermalis AM13 = DSM 14728]